ncbi:MAG: replication initiator protein A [Streptococcaceae bacterium]|jgi:hypothetical protein|nr:replication initiator protein A [Streptococcaceae bacterium]
MNLETFVPYTRNELKEMTFVKYFKIFDQYERFRELSAQAIILYGFLLDRLSYFELRGELLTDKNNLPFVLMSEKEMAFRCRCSVRKVSDFKKELQKFGLIQQKRLSWNNIERPDGFKMKFDKQPNAIFVGHIQVYPNDVEVNFEFENDGMKKKNKLKANGEIKKEKQETVVSMLITGNKPSLAAGFADNEIAQPCLSANPAANEKTRKHAPLCLSAKSAVNDKPSQDGLSANSADITNLYNLIDTNTDTYIDTSSDFSQTSEKRSSPVEKMVKNFNKDTEWLKQVYHDNLKNYPWLNEAALNTLLLFGDLFETQKYIDMVLEAKRKVENTRTKANKKYGLYHWHENPNQASRLKIQAEIFVVETQKVIQRVFREISIRLADENKDSIKNFEKYFFSAMQTHWTNVMLNMDFYNTFSEPYKLDDMMLEGEELEDIIRNIEIMSELPRDKQIEWYDKVHGLKRGYFHGEYFQDLGLAASLG